MKDCSYKWIVFRVLLGLVMLIPGLLKLFVAGAGGVSGMLAGMALFAWAPAFWAWILIACEILFGIAVIFGFKLRYTVWPPIIILVIAAFSVHWGNWPSFLLHIAAAWGFYMIGCCCDECKMRHQIRKKR